MNDDEIIEWMRRLASPAFGPIADRIEALAAENASLRANEGRVPVSWNECADWLDAGGVVKFSRRPADLPWVVSGCSSDRFRSGEMGSKGYALMNYRLLPPSYLVAAPAGMDGGGFLGAGEHVPNGWEWRRYLASSSTWFTQRPEATYLVQCRPPVKPPQRATVEVPLTQLVGNTIEGCDKPVQRWRGSSPGGGFEWSGPGAMVWHDFPAGTLDLSTGLVLVYAEGDQA